MGFVLILLSLACLGYIFSARNIPLRPFLALIVLFVLAIFILVTFNMY